MKTEIWYKMEMICCDGASKPRLAPDETMVGGLYESLDLRLSRCKTEPANHVLLCNQLSLHKDPMLADAVSNPT